MQFGSYSDTMDFMSTWKSVIGYEGLYEVSDDGQVRSLPRRRTPGKMLKFRPGHAGHPRVSLSKDGEIKDAFVHALVLEAFVSPRPPGKISLHWNGNPTDNRVSNLRWGAHKENSEDSVRHGTNLRERQTHCTHGHSLTGKNLYESPRGVRYCKSCQKANSITYRTKGLLEGDPRHGTPAGYSSGCRCEDCTPAMRAYERSTYALRKAGV